MRGACANASDFAAARLKRALTQEQLALAANMDVKTVRKAERGQRVDISSLGRLANVLQIDLGQLLTPERSESEREARGRAVVDQWHRLWDAEDGAALAALYHEHAILHLPGRPQIPFGGTYRGREAIRKANETAWTTCRTEPARADEFSLLAHDDTVILQGIKGVFLPDGSVARLWCVQIFRFEGDRIAEQRVEYDTLEFARLLQFPSANSSESSL